MSGFHGIMFPSFPPEAKYMITIESRGKAWRWGHLRQLVRPFNGIALPETNQRPTNLHWSGLHFTYSYFNQLLFFSSINLRIKGFCYHHLFIIYLNLLSHSIYINYISFIIWIFFWIIQIVIATNYLALNVENVGFINNWLLIINMIIAVSLNCLIWPVFSLQILIAFLFSSVQYL